MNNMNTKMKSQQLVKMAMMAALACVVGLIRFPLIPAVSFLTYDFADIPILITTFAFGPASGLLVLTVVSFIQAFLMGGDGFYGFIMHIIASGVFLMIAGLMYRKHKTKKSRDSQHADRDPRDDARYGRGELLHHDLLPWR